MNLTGKSHELFSEFVLDRRIRYAVDATLGRGRDALALCEKIENGKVFGFDVQKAAIDESRKLFASKSIPSEKYEFFLSGHEDMAKLLPEESLGKIGAVFFNLGWLPTSDKKLSTKPETTLRALNSFFTLAEKENSCLSVISYRAHKGGADEYEVVKKIFQQEYDRFKSLEIFGDESKEGSPILFFARY